MPAAITTPIAKPVSTEPTIAFTLDREQIDKYIAACARAVKAIVNFNGQAEQCILLIVEPGTEPAVEVWSLTSTSHSVHSEVKAAEVSAGFVLIDQKDLLRMNAALKGKETVNVLVEKKQLVYQITLNNGAVSELRETIYFQQTDYTRNSYLCKRPVAYSAVANDNAYLSEMLSRVSSAKGCGPYKIAFLDSATNGNMGLFAQFSESGWVKYTFPTGMYAEEPFDITINLESIASFGFKGDRGLDLFYSSQMTPNGALRFLQTGQEVNLLIMENAPRTPQKIFGRVSEAPPAAQVVVSFGQLMEALSFQGYGTAADQVSVTLKGKPGALSIAGNTSKTSPTEIEAEYTGVWPAEGLTFDLTALTNGLNLLGSTADGALLSIDKVRIKAASQGSTAFIMASPEGDAEWNSSMIQYERKVHS